MSNSLSMIRTDVIARIDHATLIDLLSSWAGSMDKRGYISLKETNALRVALNEFYCSQDDEYNSLLLNLAQSQSLFFQQLLMRLGPMNLAQNIARISFMRFMDPITTTCRELITHILPKVQLVFNRPMYQYVENQKERTILISTIFLDFIEEIENALHILERSRSELSYFITHENSENLEFVEQLAEIAGMSGVKSPSIFACSEKMALGTLALGLKHFHHISIELIHALQRNGLKIEKMAHLNLLFEHLDHQALACEKLEWQMTHDLEIWESRRLSLMITMYTINEYLKEISSILLLAIEQQAGFPCEKSQTTTSYLQRELVVRLMQKGVEYKAASESCAQLISYCYQKDIDPSALILGELHRFNPLFDQETLSFLQQLHEDFALQNRSSHEKHRNVERVTRLSKVFAV